MSSGDFGDRERAEYIESLRLDPARQISSPTQHSVYALTDRHLCVATRGGFRERPTELLHAGPRDGLQVYWYDGRVEAGSQFRHFVFVFADGAWRGDRTGIKSMGRVPKGNNADPFIAALGPAAVQLT